MLAGPELGDLVTGLAMVGSALKTFSDPSSLFGLLSAGCRTLGSGDFKVEKTLCPVSKILAVLGVNLLAAILST